MSGKLWYWTETYLSNINQDKFFFFLKSGDKPNIHRAIFILFIFSNSNTFQIFGWTSIHKRKNKNVLILYIKLIVAIMSYIISATEYRNWLLYYSLPCMKGILDEEYHQHYALLVGGISLLSRRSISPEQLEMAGRLLMHFVEMFDAYYGENEDFFCILRWR